jgi:menaquinol-cytochrome c reductase iron-sulfur subunit
MADERGLVARRSFYLLGIYALWTVVCLALAVPAVVYLLIPARTRRKQGWTDAGGLALLKPNEPEEVTFQRVRADGWKVTAEKSTAWMVRTGENTVTVFAPQCTHLGCAYHWEAASRNFVCPCHTSAFSIDGKVLRGPAPRALDRYQVRIEGGRVRLGAIEPAERS